MMPTESFGGSMLHVSGGYLTITVLLGLVGGGVFSLQLVLLAKLDGALSRRGNCSISPRTRTRADWLAPPDPARRRVREMESRAG